MRRLNVYIINFTLLVFCCIVIYLILRNIYFKKEGFKVKSVTNFAKKQSERVVSLANKIEDSLPIKNPLEKIVEPVANLKKNLMNTLNFFKQF